MTSVAPGSASRIGNAYYKTEEEFLYACAEAMREEYKAIVDAGLILQLDDPAIAENWDMINPEPTVEEYRKFSMVRVEALNHAITGLPQDRIRFHLCWGSWHGPHTTDIPMRDIVEVMLAINAGAYSFEAGNVRHEHEWKVWQEVKLPDDKLILPGVVSHATNVVEHPELVAERILRFAKLVGRERVIAVDRLRARRARPSATSPGRSSRRWRKVPRWPAGNCGAESQPCDERTAMKASSNRILTTHVGSLPRPDDLIAANRSREAGEGDETAFRKAFAQRWSMSSSTERPASTSGRRRVRQVDGTPRQLRRMDELRVSPPGRSRSRRARHARYGRRGGPPGPARADELCRPARSRAVCGRIC